MAANAFGFRAGSRPLDGPSCSSQSSLAPPEKARPQRDSSNEAVPVLTVGFHRSPPGGRLHVRIRRRTPSRLDLGSDHRIAAGFHGGVRFLLVRQKFTSYSINAVVLLSIGGAVLALHTSGDRPEGESKKVYSVLMTLGAAALYGLILPMMELTYKKAKQSITYSLVLEIQMVMSLFATLFAPSAC
ncbi:hypothetical protein FNV43_RR12163 [Rhamnella rubrinervis]|uniref:Uncharacterized protein n=1 Tax=Rhamnella rubrinervis TaxID=2594499 RepID=A0A8K0H7U9_9ROSA|nr:hypothetical protein FNV43_RR12163 [Rhamnella rubrinervis]